METQDVLLLWMDEIHFAPLCNHRKPLFVGIYKGIRIFGFLRWCRISSIHSSILHQGLNRRYPTSPCELLRPLESTRL